MKKQKITIIIPTLNEAECIETVLKELSHNDVDEILVVDGHSVDGTPELIRRLGFNVITQDGKGYGAAMNTGIKHAIGDIIIPMDADGSYDPKDIPDLVECIENGFDVAFASRYLPDSGSHDDTIIRFVGNKLFTFLINKIHGVKISDSLFLYVAAKKEVFKSLNLGSSGFEFCIEFPIKMQKAGFRYTEIPSFERERIAGKSKVNAFLDGLRILWYLLKWKFIDTNFSKDKIRSDSPDEILNAKENVPPGVERKA